MKKTVALVVLCFVAFLTAASCGRVTQSAVMPTVLADTAVKVNFGGLIVHVFGSTIGERNRAVVLNDADHPIKLSLPEEIDTTVLKNVTGETASSPSGGQVEIFIKNPFTIRIVGWDKTNKKVTGLMKPVLTVKPSFSDYVPSLKAVSDDTFDQWLLKPTLFDSVPDNSDWAVFFNLDGGDLTAEPSCEGKKKTKLINDYKGYGDRFFANLVTLTGKVEGEPAIQFLKKAGKWETVPLKAALTGPATFELIAHPAGGGIGKSHFKKFFDKMADPKPSKVDDIKYVDCKQSGLDPTCTNSQWP